MTDLAELRKVAEAATLSDGRALNIQRHLRYIATFDPPIVLALLDVVKAAEAMADAVDTWTSTKPEQAVLEAALARLDAL